MKFSFLLRLALLVSALTAASASAANRSLTVTAPAKVKPGADIQAVVTASTDATDGEHIAFFHAEFSADGGATWTSRYSDVKGVSATRTVNFDAGASGTKAMVRVRIAFRGGKAGDVDFTGAPISWEGSWSKWESPPAKFITVEVSAR